MIWLLAVYPSFHPFLAGGLLLPRWSRAFDLIGVMFASTAFVTTVGASLSAWLVIDAAADYKRLTADDEESN
jgi:hypothetical protein